MENVTQILELNGFEKVAESVAEAVYSKELEKDHIVQYYTDSPYSLHFAKDIQMGNYITKVSAEFQFETEEELEVLLKNFRHLNTGIIVDTLAFQEYENQSI